MAERIRAFLLTRHWRDTARGLEFEFWAASERGPLRIRITEQEAVCFAPANAPIPNSARRGPVNLRNLEGRPIDALYFTSQAQLDNARAAFASAETRLYESDVKPLERFLMERFIQGSFSATGEFHARRGHLEALNPEMSRDDFSPALTVAALDIETSDMDGDLYSIAVATRDHERVFMVGEGPNKDAIRYFPNETAVIRAFLDWIREIDPDVLIGWNVIAFDLAFLIRKSGRLDVPLALGRAEGRAKILPPATQRQSATARVPGRVVLDGIDALRTAMWDFEEFSLEYVARELLGRGKLVEGGKRRVEEIRRMYREDKRALAEYNLEDCRLVLDIFDAAKLLPFAVERSKLTGHPLDRQGGSVAAFDFQYLPRLHRKGHVAPDVGSVSEPVASPGGYVLDSIPGLYDNVLVFDFKSLYPSIIRTFLIDPLGMAFPGEDPVPGFEGARFNRREHILPGLIESLWRERDRAKQEGNQPLSQAIKILMNSFYGVLGTPGCRFYHPALASSVTLRGHEVITRSKEFLEQTGLRVIYGDTDSLFLLIGPGKDETECRDIGDDLVRRLNAWWKDVIQREHRLESFLEIEFETHYIRFLMPTIRGSNKGSKKRYAGVVRKPDGGFEVVFRGLESVRTDWTPLARRFQRELYRRIFLGEPYEDYIRRTAEDLLRGKLNEELVYRKRVRRELDSYTKSTPPHVQAARKLDRPGRWVSYIVTVNGPEPVETLQSPPDYAHYLDRQLAPIADGILQFFGTNFAALTEKQLEMF